MKKPILKIVLFLALASLGVITCFILNTKEENVVVESNTEDLKETVITPTVDNAADVNVTSNQNEKTVVTNSKRSSKKYPSNNKISPKENKANDSIEQLRAKYSSYLLNHPFAKSRTLPKVERRAMGIPPNAYYEQEWLYSSNPNLGRPEPEVVLQLQMELEEQEKLNRVPGDGLDNQWIERGPNNVGGRTRALMFAPGSTTKVIAGGVSGGVWINNDITSAASIWQQVNGVPSNLAVSCITADPNNSNIMYIGTGEVYTWGAVNGNGVYKSIDGGQNWFNIFGAATNANVRDNITYIQDIIAWNNPTTNQTEIFFGTDAMRYTESIIGAPEWAWLGLNTIGLYRSTDGLNFTKLNNTSLKDINNRNYAPNTFDIGADGKLWMGTKYSYTYPIKGGMLFSTTNGSTWNLVRDFGTNGRVEVVCSKQNANKLYVLLEDNEDTTIPAKIKRTTDGFTTSNINITPPVSIGNQPPAANDFCRGQAFFDLMIGVDPNNDNTFYVGGIEIFKSTNSGGSFSQLTDWTVNPGSKNGSLNGVHSDQHCISFASSSRVVFGNDGGIYYTNDGGVNMIDRNKGYNTAQFVKAGINQTGTTQKLLAGAQDNGSQFINNAPAGQGAATRVTGGDGFYCFIDQQDSYMVASYVYNVYHRLNINGGGSTRFANNQADGDFVNQCELDSNSDILYANGTNGTTYRIYRYSGATFTTRDDLTNSLLNNVPTAFRASPYTSNRMIVGLANGRLLRLNNANATPTWTSFGDASWVSAISDIRYGASENDIFVTFHNYGVPSVWYSSNGGASWQNKEGDLPNLPVKCILQNPFAANEVIIGTELGVWYTVNFNAISPTWRRSNNGMKDVKVHSFDYRVVDNTILAATYGRGMFTGTFWKCGDSTTTWNGTSWSNGIPNKRVAAVFNGNYTSTADLETCSVTINGTAQVTFNAAHTLKVGEGVTVASGALLILENNAALVQFSSSAVNSGNITVKRNSQPMIRQDYTAWSSPVSGQQLQSFSPNTLPNRFYQYLYTGTTTPTAYQSVTATTNFTVGKGYMIRSADNSSPTVPSVHNGVFTGVPITGKISSPIGIGFNLLGNPYPSPINADRILITNPGVNTLYFWTHRVAASGGTYPVNNYASYTILGGAASQGGTVIPNGIIQTGQGFYIQARTANNVIFENELRRDASISTQFFRNGSTTEDLERHRIWLNLKGADLEYNQILIGYMNGASSGVDAMIDGESLDKSKTMIYNLISNNEYVIQGRALPFSNDDIVPLGLKVIEAGNYEISLENLDGLFVTQEVFVKDNVTGILHDIKQGSYSFSAQAGTFNNRFELVYKNAALSNDNFENVNIVNAFSSNGILNIVSSKNNIKAVEVYDILGKVIYSNNNVNALELVISSIATENQTLLIKINLDSGKQVNKKVIF